MHDRVAEILDERAALGGSVPAGVTLSLALHAAIIAAALYAALHQPPPQEAQVLRIRFAPISPAVRTTSPQRVTPPRAKTLQPPQPRVEEVKAAAKVEKAVPMSPFGRSAKRGTETPAPPPPAAVPAPASGLAADVPVGGAGVTALEGGDFPYTLYIERMKTLIGSRWFRPEVTAGTNTIVYFIIDRDGTIRRDAKTEQPSGSGTFDRAALRAVLESSPLPPLPFGYNGTFLGVHLLFK